MAALKKNKAGKVGRDTLKPLRCYDNDFELSAVDNGCRTVFTE